MDSIVPAKPDTIIPDRLGKGKFENRGIYSNRLFGFLALYTNF